MRLLCKQTFEKPSQLEMMKPGYKKHYHEVLFEEGKDYLINYIDSGVLMIVNEEISRHYIFSLDPDTRGRTANYKDVYYGDYFELIDPENIPD